ncbi:MAG: hypothetical protein ACE5SW_09785 [Nitrososphaeraceae archaeon]
MVAAVLVGGTTFSLGVPSSFAQPYYEDPYAQDPYAKDDRKKASDVNIQKIKCFNKNTNVNGVDVNQIPDQNGLAEVEAQGLEGGENMAANAINNGEGNGLNLDRNLVNFCINDNDNGQEQVQQSNGLTVGSLYIVEGPVVNNQFPNGAESIASCDAGDFVISGGFNFIPEGELNDFDFINNLPTATLDGWSASFDTGLGSTVPAIQATAVCFDAQ